MTLWQILLVCSPLFNFASSTDLAQDLKHILYSYDPDPKCVFNYTEVNSKTIKFFPKCDTAFGILVLNEHTDLSMVQLKNAFKKMKSLGGGIRVENSKLTSLDFLSLEEVMCETYGIFILNNSRLTNASALGSITMYGDDFGNECKIQVENNVKLDAEGLCDSGSLKTLMDMKVEGNFKDCGCQGDQVTESSFLSYKNCTKLFRGFKPSNIIMIDKSHGLSNIQTIRGGIDVRDCAFHNLSFFENLETIEVNNEGEGEKFVLNLDFNVIMMGLAFPKLKRIANKAQDGIKLANIGFADARFCLTIEELIFFLEQEVSFQDLWTKICVDNRTTVSSLTVCNVTSTLSGIPDNCNLIIGDLIITGRDEPALHKLSNVSHLFGMLAVENSSLEGLDGLDTLRYILQLNSSLPVVQIVGNQKLKSAMIKNIENVITNANRTAIFQDNFSELFKNQSCNLFQDQNSTSRNYRMRLDYVGGDCGDRVDVVYRFSMSNNCFSVLNLLIVFISLYLGSKLS